MPCIIDYPAVVAMTQAKGWLSLYPASGAFGYAPSTPTHSVGWIAADDSTIRAEARSLAVDIPEPAPANLARLATAAWREILSDDVAWVTPKAHWAYELDFGSAAWMPDLLTQIGVRPAILETRHDGTAITFERTECNLFRVLIEGLLTNLFGSDFQMMFPTQDLVCSIHHHKQLWWTSRDASLINRLRQWPKLPVRT